MTGYVYDGEGRRVGKGPISAFSCDMTANGFHPAREYIVGLGGEQLGETDGGYDLLHSNVFANGGLLATNTASAWYYALNDWLETKRVEAKADGTVAASFLSLPFGDGLAQQGPGPDATEHHFTGKERDSESGLDNFGARYYGSSIGRFLSPDPKAPSAKILINPQKWNKYVYVLNNPLALFDPDGQEELTIQLRAYIPQATELGFKGDNRGPTTSQNVTSRTSITLRVETDPSKSANPLLGAPVSRAGQTENLVTGQTATQTVGLPTATVTRDANGNVVINIQQSAANPLTPQGATPPIKSDLNITIPADASSITTAGTVSGSPVFELNVGTEGGANINTLLQGASSNPLAFGYNLTQTNPILNMTPLPPPPPACVATGVTCYK